MRGTKGVHVAVPRDRLRHNGALTLLSPIDGRVMFVLPAGAFSIEGCHSVKTAWTFLEPHVHRTH